MAPKRNPNPSAVWLGAALFTALLAACGGGSDTSTPPVANQPTPLPPPPAGSVGTAEGVFSGSLSGSPTAGVNAQIMAVLEDGQYWTVYGARAADGSFEAAGFVQGTGAASANNSVFISSNARDYSMRAVLEGGVTATFVPHTSVQGTVAYTQPVAFSVNFMGTAAAVAPYDYAQAASLTSVAGDWRIRKLGGRPGNAQVGADGNYQWQADGCAVTGTVTPRASGKNVFDVTQTTGPAPCQFPGSVQRGVGLLLPVGDGQRSQFITATLDEARNAWSYTSGVR